MSRFTIEQVGTGAAARLVWQAACLVRALSRPFFLIAHGCFEGDESFGFSSAFNLSPPQSVPCLG